MATNNNKKSMTVPVITSHDWIDQMIELGRPPVPFYICETSHPGEGKSAHIDEQVKKGMAFSIKAEFFCENSSPFPVVVNYPPTMEEIFKASKDVDEFLAKKGEEVSEATKQRMIEAQVKVNRVPEIATTRYKELEEFLKGYVPTWKKTGKAPTVYVDEYTQVDHKGRARIVEELVNGAMCRRLGLPFLPFVVACCNGKTWGGVMNYPLQPMEVARMIRVIYQPDGNDDIPVTTEGINTLGCKNLRKEHSRRVTDGFTSGKDSFPTGELPHGDPGNPRVQHVLLWYTEAVRKSKGFIRDPIPFMTTIVYGICDADLCQDAMEMVKQFFTTLPASIEEVRQLMNDDAALKALKSKLSKISSQEWTSWAKFRTDGFQSTDNDLARFLGLLGVDGDTCEQVKRQSRAR